MRQVVTETEFMRAVFDYMAEQLEGRFRLEFPSSEDMINQMVESLRDDCLRLDSEFMLGALRTSISSFGTYLTQCMLDGCPEEETHKFYREWINLVWDSRRLTNEWLKGQGVVPGQSAN